MLSLSLPQAWQNYIQYVSTANQLQLWEKNTDRGSVFPSPPISAEQNLVSLVFQKAKSKLLSNL